MRIQGYAKMGDAVACITYIYIERESDILLSICKKNTHPFSFFQVQEWQAAQLAMQQL